MFLFCFCFCFLLCLPFCTPILSHREEKNHSKQSLFLNFTPSPSSHFIPFSLLLFRFHHVYLYSVHLLQNNVLHVYFIASLKCHTEEEKKHPFISPFTQLRFPYLPFSFLLLCLYFFFSFHLLTFFFGCIS